MSRKIVFILLGSALVLGIALMWFWQRNVYSKDALKLEILAPEKTAMSEEMTYLVKYKNNGNFRLERAALIFDFPAGSVPSEGTKLRVIKSLDDIYPGQEQTLEFKGRLFGKEGEVKEARAALTYRPKNLSAAYQSDTTSSIIISSVPITLSLDVPASADNLRVFDFTLNYSSGSSYPLADLRLKLEYPSGFELLKSSPHALGENEWDIGLLNKGEGGKVSLQGQLQGSLGEAKVFRAVLGSWREGNFIVLKEETKAVHMATPFLVISQTINSSANYIASAGDNLHYEIAFKNISEGNLENLFLVVKLEGRAFDFSTLRSERGRFTLGDSSILWETGDLPQLAFLGQGEEGRVEFWIKARENWSPVSKREKNFLLRSTVLLGDVKSRFDTKINSKVEVQQKGYFEDEVFGNSGPLPPQVGEGTSYTITWEVKNYHNDVQSAKVQAFLPEGVESTGKVFPENSPLSFEKGDREFVWNLGELPAGAGIFDDAPSVSFQIRFTPDLVYKGTTPQLIGEAKLTGEDTFTGQQISASDTAISSDLPDDPSVSQEKGIVQ